MFLFFDTETTGLSSLKDHVVQLAWVLADEAGNIKAEECHVIRPDGYAIPDAAARIHGITTAKACQIGQPLALVLDKFSKAAARAAIIIAHNLSFDLGILKHDYQIADLPFPLHGKTQICTMKLSTAWCRLPKLNGSTGFKWPKLDELHYRLFGEGFEGAHDALKDTHACLRCFFELVKWGVITLPNRPQKTTKPATSADYEDLIIQCSRALAIDQNNAWAWLNIGIALRSLKRYEDAIHAYNRALEIEPNDEITWLNKGFALANLKYHEDAILAYNQILKINSKNIEAWFFKGSAFCQLKRYEDAIQAYNRALEIDPNCGFAWGGKSKALYGLHRFEEGNQAKVQETACFNKGAFGIKFF